MRGGGPRKCLRTAGFFAAVFAVQIVIGLLLGSSFFSTRARATLEAEAPTPAFLDRAPDTASMSVSSHEQVLALEVTDQPVEPGEAIPQEIAVEQIVAFNEGEVSESENIESVVARLAGDVAITVSHAVTAELQSIIVASSPVSVFPVLGGGPFSSSFGAPRPGGRIHKGNDILAEKMTPVVAVAAGTVVGAPDGPGDGCCYVKLRHEDGSHTVYIHLNNDTPGTDDGLGWGLAEGMAVGTFVESGTVIGYVGDSGNAEDTAPHLHFEYHPPGSEAVDPYELLRGAQLLADVDAEPAVTVEADELPYTGSEPVPLTVLAALSVVLGVLVLWASSRPWVSARLGSDWEVESRSLRDVG